MEKLPSDVLRNKILPLLSIRSAHLLMTLSRHLRQSLLNSSRWEKKCKSRWNLDTLPPNYWFWLQEERNAIRSGGLGSIGNINELRKRISSPSDINNVDGWWWFVYHHFAKRWQQTDHDCTSQLSLYLLPSASPDPFAKMGYFQPTYVPSMRPAMERCISKALALVALLQYHYPTLVDLTVAVCRDVHSYPFAPGIISKCAVRIHATVHQIVVDDNYSDTETGSYLEFFLLPELTASEQIELAARSRSIDAREIVSGKIHCMFVRCSVDRAGSHPIAPPTVWECDTVEQVISKGKAHLDNFHHDATADRFVAGWLHYHANLSSIYKCAQQDLLQYYAPEVRDRVVRSVFDSVEAKCDQLLRSLGIECYNCDAQLITTWDSVLSDDDTKKNPRQSNITRVAFLRCVRRCVNFLLRSEIESLCEWVDRFPRLEREPRNAEKEKVFQCVFDVMVFGPGRWRYEKPDPLLDALPSTSMYWCSEYVGSNELYDLLRSQRTSHRSIHKSKPEMLTYTLIQKYMQLALPVIALCVCIVSSVPSDSRVFLQREAAARLVALQCTTEQVTAISNALSL